MCAYRTPLRYPGGKQQLTPFIVEILRENDLLGGCYVEPYAGGAGVAIELLLNHHVQHIYLNDSSLPIYAFWHSLLNRTDDLCNIIATIPLTIEEWRYRQSIVNNATNHDLFDVGLSTLYLNRCNRSGILTAGVIGGIAQTGKWKMNARFNRETLIRRIQAIAVQRDSITIYNRDASTFMVEDIPRLPHNTLVYCDPPYFEKSSRLYLDTYTHTDHVQIAEIIQHHLCRHWVVSYDGVDQILQFYSQRQAFLYYLNYHAQKRYQGREVFIFSDEVQIPVTSSLKYINIAIENRALASMLVENS